MVFYLNVGPNFVNVEPTIISELRYNYQDFSPKYVLMFVFKLTVFDF